MIFEPDQSQKWSLLTWYAKDNPLHFEARHPCIGLAGEAGELLNLYKKFEYKPGYDFDRDKFLLELSDYSYYLRILAYQKGVTFEALCKDFENIGIQEYYSRGDLLASLSDLSLSSSILLNRYLSTSNIFGSLKDCTFYFLAILHKLDCSLENLLELNYRKLNSEEMNHGWKHATIKR